MGLFDHFRKPKDHEVIYDADVDYAALEQSEYDDSPGYVFYTCPKCGGEYLATFIMSENGETMCIDCAS